jgi:hypothetical protein
MTIRLPPPGEPGSRVVPYGKQAPGAARGRARAAPLAAGVSLTVGRLAVWLAVAVVGGALAYQALERPRPEPPPRARSHHRRAHTHERAGNRTSLPGTEADGVPR